MKILKIEVGKEPYTKEMPHTLQALQNEVGGLIEVVYIQDKLLICCNEEGKINGMKPNRQVGNDIIYGDFFMVSDTGDGDFCSLSGEQIENMIKYFNDAQQFSDNEIEQDTLIIQEDLYI